MNALRTLAEVWGVVGCLAGIILVTDRCDPRPPRPPRRSEEEWAQDPLNINRKP